jgi:hypothetical protein
MSVPPQHQLQYLPVSALPPGVEQRIDVATGRLYYVDHVRRTTSWDRPASGTMAPIAGVAQAAPLSVAPPPARGPSGKLPRSVARAPSAPLPPLAAGGTQRGPSGGGYAPAVPSRDSQQFRLASNALPPPPPPHRSPSPPPPPGSRGTMTLQQLPFASSPTPGPTSLSQCQKITNQMMQIAQGVDLGIISSRAGYDSLHECTTALEALKRDAAAAVQYDERLRNELINAARVGETVAGKLTQKRLCEVYCEELQKLHISINALQERCRGFERSVRAYEEATGGLSMLRHTFERIRQSAPAVVDEPTSAYAEKLHRLMLQLDAETRQLYVPPPPSFSPPAPLVMPSVPTAAAANVGPTPTLRRTADALPGSGVMKAAEAVPLRRTAGDVSPRSNSPQLSRNNNGPISPRCGGGGGAGNVSPRMAPKSSHSFTIISSLTPINCSLCGRLRTSLKSFSCGSCGFVVHKHCLPLVPPFCKGMVADEGAALMSTDEPQIIHQALEAKHRGLQAVDLSQVEMEGPCWKRSRNNRWRQRFFILPKDPTQCVVFYFDGRPSATSLSIPLGCLHLTGASVQECEVDERPQCLVVGSAAMERKIVLDMESRSELKKWKAAIEGRIMAQLNGVIGASPVSGNSLPSLGEKESVAWSSLPRVSRPRGPCSLELQMLAPGPRDFPLVECFDADACDLPFRVGVEKLTGGTTKPGGILFVVVRAYYAGKAIIPEVQTRSSAAGSWNQSLELSPMLSSLPCETVLMFSLYETAPSDTSKLRKLFMGDEGVTTCLGHCHLPLTDECGFVRAGKQRVSMWPGEGSAVHFSFDAPSGSPPVLHVNFPEPPLPLAYTSFPAHLLADCDISADPERFVDALLPVDPACPNPLALVSQESLQEAWDHRYDARPDILDWVFLGCNFLDPVQRAEAAILCKNPSVWNIPLYVALHLVGFSFSAAEVRAQAMRQVCSMLSNEAMKELAVVILYAIRFELHDWSPLIEVLLRRVASNNELVFTYFWAAYAQADISTPLGARFKMFVTVLLEMVPKGQRLQSRDCKYVEQIIALTRDDTRRTNLPTLLKAQKWDEFVLPTSTKHRVLSLDLENTHTLGSSAGPVFFRFFSASFVPDFIVKAGDDIRQDELVLLIGSMMNQIWQTCGLPVKLVTYQCKSVGNKVGFIEVVPNCSSLGKVQGYSLSGTFQRTAITDWLQANRTSKTLWNDIIENYMSSLAAACVFDYVMGLGDRHCDNILLSPTGLVFHIDFGMILDKDYGVAATIPFTLTQQMLDVIGGKDSDMFRKFVNLCTNAFMAVRQHHVLFTTFAMLAVGGKLPSCKSIEDVQHLYKAFMPTLSEADAMEKFKSLIFSVTESLAPQLNDAMHSFFMKYISKSVYK